MQRTHSCSPRASRRKPLAACVAAFFVLGSPVACATTFVTNCNDSGVGSLRKAIATTGDGDYVDMRGLTTDSPGCAESTITLTTGDINFFQDNLTILGPGEKAFTVTGKYKSASHIEPYRIFSHTGAGTFEIDDLSVTKGYATGVAGAAQGGCISSTGSVKLKHVTLSFCYAKSTSEFSYGGAIYSHDGVSLYYSTLEQNAVNGPNGGFSRGGAVRTRGFFYSYFSTIESNSAGKTSYARGGSGGVDASGLGKCVLASSTVSNNSAYAGGIGGISLICSGGISVVNSTISGNSAGDTGGIYTRSPFINLYNSTIAFNTATSPSSGLRMLVNGQSTSANMHGMLIANNTYGATNTPSDVTGGLTVGSNNLIFAPASSVPPDTIVGKCPLLFPLADNGGQTSTHALHTNSPAIDAGINPLALTFDQRGTPFVRASGPPGTMTPLPDIGAFEVDRSDAIFESNFGGCP